MNRCVFSAADACRRALLALTLLAAAGCASVPFDYPKQPSVAVPRDAATPLGEQAAGWEAQHGSKAALVGMSSGVDALGARLRLLEVAQKSVDAQYFIIKKDRAGALFAGGLLAAADRGVQVRLLVDDVFSPGVDEAFTILAAHPNIEIRIFNPLSRSFRYLSYLADFKRANRRMHNKSFTVDNSMSIVGGRNIGEEYFELNPAVKFDDYEVLVMGEVVGQISDGFDVFWNSELAVPIEAFANRADVSRLDDWREQIREVQQEQQTGLYATALNSSLLRDLRSGKIKPAVAETTLYTDTPDKLSTDVGNIDHAILVQEMVRRMRAAEKEIVIVTPYYIPQQAGAELIEEILAKGVRVVVVTNSLASTNHVAVHSGYARYRKRLLRAGAEFYEIRADAIGEENDWGKQPEQITLHSKATTIDRDTVFIGSLNFDPRSIFINSEMGLFIDSEEIGSRFTEELGRGLAPVTWKVELDENDKLRWTFDDGNERLVVHKEPGASWWRRFQVGFYRLLPIESQL